MATYYTVIEANGSKFMGQMPDPIEKLYEILKLEPLDPIFEKYGNFIFFEHNSFKFRGNFANFSHVFNITTNDPRVIDNLINLITENQNSQAYRALR